MRAKPVSSAEQYRLVLECRSSGMTDCQWCQEQGIKPGTFYSWVRNLRQNGHEDIPPVRKTGKIPDQEVVRLEIPRVPSETADPEPVPDSHQYPVPPFYPFPVLELSVPDAVLRIPQNTDMEFLEQLVRILRRPPC